MGKVGNQRNLNEDGMFPFLDCVAYLLDRKLDNGSYLLYEHSFPTGVRTCD